MINKDELCRLCILNIIGVQDGIWCCTKESCVYEKVNEK